MSTTVPDLPKLRWPYLPYGVPERAATAATPSPTPPGPPEPRRNPLGGIIGGLFSTKR